jgi:hypothetical protein
MTEIVNGYREVTEGAGKKMDTSQVTVEAVDVQRERAIVADPAETQYAPVQDYNENDIGLVISDVNMKKLLNVANKLSHEIHLLRLAMEESML